MLAPVLIMNENPVYSGAPGRFSSGFAVFVLLAVWVAAAPVRVSGQDGLYAPQRPENTAFVRVANMSRETAPAVQIGNLRFAPQEHRTVSPYRLVPVDGYVIGGRGGTFFTPAAGGFYTIFFQGQPAHNSPARQSTPAGSPAGDGSPFAVVQDTPHNDAARAQVNLYNRTDQPLALVALQPEGVILQRVDPGERRDRALNAIPVTVAVQHHSGVSREESLGTASDSTVLNLRRGASYSVFAYHGDDRRIATVVAEAVVRME